ncbi:MAG: hypothetical protein COT81_01540 [Candidatus Buchananbacteria bacterium CG10_big_fil_rev_8_21_14_0_10_42_9]|uniref:Uncharacterized protein n=1 Tax=Candidatus Buchananbacteria bacterium CG10_big_fil_rev_8_21_14_0_10_42_9 TaxID=1974526 RepID=A0A2H0W1V5_9BACT|nr:MAG: hypothetical protein COT81_01540 [Candidatus Buchananbacteria bacterium CG10_big_fil_rev_8_21_14_0_10_42_9]
MENLAPDITRQRLLLEGYFTIEVNEKTIKDYFTFICKNLGLRVYGKPIIFSPGGEGKDENQGYDAFIPLIDSGISLYVWSSAKFISVIIYTCKEFDESGAIDGTKAFFKMDRIEHQAF